MNETKGQIFKSIEMQSLDWLYDISCNVQNTTEEYKIVKQALQRLEALDNAKPSDALKYFSIIENEIPKTWGIITKEGRYMLDTIKSTLIKAQEQESENKALLEENNDLYAELTLGGKQYKELTGCVKQYKKVLEIILKKNVDIFWLKNSKTKSDYNNHVFITKANELTEEEFDLLKKYSNEMNEGE